MFMQWNGWQTLEKGSLASIIVREMTSNSGDLAITLSFNYFDVSQTTCKIKWYSTDWALVLDVCDPLLCLLSLLPGFGIITTSTMMAWNC